MNLYKILGIPKNASKQEVRHAYLELAKLHHPDKNGDPEKFKQIGVAYNVLYDEEKRKLYDETGTVLDESVDQMAHWITTKSIEIIEIWLRHKIEGHSVPNFSRFLKEQILRNRNRLSQDYEKIAKKSLQLDKLDNFATIEEGENLFTATIQRLKQELLEQKNFLDKEKHKLSLLEESFKAYEFEEMTVNEVMAATIRFNVGGPSSTTSFETFGS